MDLPMMADAAEGEYVLGARSVRSRTDRTRGDW